MKQTPAVNQLFWPFSSHDTLTQLSVCLHMIACGNQIWRSHFHSCYEIQKVFWWKSPFLCSFLFFSDWLTCVKCQIWNCWCLLHLIQSFFLITMLIKACISSVKLIKKKKKLTLDLILMRNFYFGLALFEFFYFADLQGSFFKQLCSYLIGC